MILTVEDAADDMLVPRLIAAGADLTKVFQVGSSIKYDAKRKPIRAAVTLQGDLENLRRKIEEVGDVVLVVIDPISGYVGNVDSHNNSKLRGLGTVRRNDKRSGSGRHSAQPPDQGH